MTISFVKAMQEFFSTGPFGKKVEVAEFKALTVQDKVDFSKMLDEAKIEHTPYAPPSEKE